MLASQYFQYTENILKNQYIMRIIISIIIIIIGYIFLALVKGIFKKIETSRAAEKTTLENMYKLLYISIIIILLFLIVYVITEQSVIVLFLLGVILILLASSWEVTANLAAYYALLLSRSVQRGDYIELPEDISGRIRQITPLFTEIEDENRVYMVPNLKLLRHGKTTVKEPIKVEVEIRVWGFEDPDTINNILEILKDKIAMAGRNVLALPEAASLIVEEVSVDGVSIRAELRVPGPKPNKAKLGRLMQELAVTLKETGYSYSLVIARE